MEKIIIIGGGGHAKVLIEIVKLSGQYEIIGILDPQLEVDINIAGVSVLGNDDLLEGLHKKGVMNACIAIGSIKDNIRRKILYEKVKQMGFTIPFLIHTQTILSENVKISEGVQVMAGAIIQTGSEVEENTIVNTGSIVEHDCLIDRHVHICPGVVISGGCEISEGAFIGAGATIVQGIKIGENVIVGAGAVVVDDIPDGAKVMGIPAK